MRGNSRKGSGSRTDSAVFFLPGKWLLPEGKPEYAFPPWLQNGAGRGPRQGRAQPVHLDPLRGFRPVQPAGQIAPHQSVRKDAQPPPNGGVLWGLGSLPQQAKRGGVYRRALLASFAKQ